MWKGLINGAVSSHVKLFCSKNHWTSAMKDSSVEQGVFSYSKPTGPLHLSLCHLKVSLLVHAPKAFMKCQLSSQDYVTHYGQKTWNKGQGQEKGVVCQATSESRNLQEEICKRFTNRDSFWSPEWTHLRKCSIQFSRSVMSDSLWPHESQHARPPCPSPTPGIHPN